MKFATFDKQITELKKFYDEACARDTKIQEALGGDTQVMTDWWSSALDGILDTIKSEFDLPENDDTIDWLFYDCVCNDEEMTFEYEGINYIGNTKNVYLSLTGMLDERFGEQASENKEEAEIVPEQDNLHIRDNEKMVNGSPLLLDLKDYQIKLESVELAEKLDNIIKEKFTEDGEWKYPTEEEYYSTLRSEFDNLMIDSKNLYKRDKITTYIVNVLGHLGLDVMDRKNLEMAAMETTILLNRSKEYGEISSYKVEISEDTSSIYCSLQWEDEKPKDFRVSFKADKAMVEWL